MNLKQKSSVIALLLATLVSAAVGAEPAATAGKTPNPDGKVAQPPAGVRISIAGNSWSAWGGLLLPLAKEAGIEGHTPSLPDAHPRSDRFRCGGRESKFLAVSLYPRIHLII